MRSLVVFLIAAFLVGLAFAGSGPDGEPAMVDEPVVLMHPERDGLPPASLDSAQPDTIRYDDGQIYAYMPQVVWYRVRFTPLGCFELRSVYFRTRNLNGSTAPCSVYVHLADGRNVGSELSAHVLPGNVPNNSWVDLDLPAPLTFSACQDFYIIIGPGTGSSGWQIWSDGYNAATNTRRSMYSLSGRFGYYGFLQSWYDFMIQAGGEYVEDPNCVQDFSMPCASPAETEPNNICASQNDPLVLSGEMSVYGNLCGTDTVDMYQLVVPPQSSAVVTVLDGASCTTPTGSTLLSVFSSTCTPVVQNIYTPWTYANSSPNPANFRVMVKARLGSERYQLAVDTCAGENYAANPIEISAGNTYENIAGTCCATVSVPFVWSTNCAGTQYAAGPSVIYRFVLTGAGILTLTANSPSQDVQIMVFTNPLQPTASCVASRDVGSSGPEILPNVSLPPDTYFVSTSIYSTDHTACGPITLSILSDVPLPVELVSFEAVPGNGQVTLNWMTRAEIDNDFFELTRDGVTIAQVDATNNSSGASYTWTDRDLTNGTTYHYTLFAVDVSGQRAELESRDATPNPRGVFITEYALYDNYPNPFNPTTTITFDLFEAGPVNLKVYNLMGQEVATLVHRDLQAGRHTVNFDAAGLPSGLYIYRLNVNGFTAQNKLLLMK